MNEKNKTFLNDMEMKTNVKHEDLFYLAKSVSNTDLTKKENVRRLIHQVSQLANVPVSKEKEEELVKLITTNNVPTDFASLAKMFQQKK